MFPWSCVEVASLTCLPSYTDVTNQTFHVICNSSTDLQCSQDGVIPYSLEITQDGVINYSEDF